jgi:hypothetical protein
MKSADNMFDKHRWRHRATDRLGPPSVDRQGPCGSRARSGVGRRHHPCRPSRKGSTVSHSRSMLGRAVGHQIDARQAAGAFARCIASRGRCPLGSRRATRGRGARAPQRLSWGRHGAMGRWIRRAHRRALVMRIARQGAFACAKATSAKGVERPSSSSLDGETSDHA